MLGIRLKTTQLRDTFRLREPERISRISFELDSSRYTVKTATTKSEIRQALRLRYNVFYRELLDALSPIGIDTDRFDRACDHLLIIEKGTGKVVGTYRLRASDHVTEFFSQTEFELQPFLETSGTKLELGRACIHADHRNGMVIRLLWRGIHHYARQVGAQWLFGCSSLHSMDEQEIQSAIQALSAMGVINTSLGVTPLDPFHPGRHGMNLWIPASGAGGVGGASRTMRGLVSRELASSLPPLLQSYVRAGAKILGLPAIDVKMKCADFLTVLDLRTFQREV